MEIVNAKQVFIDFVCRNGFSVDRIQPTNGIELMLRFYAEVQAEQCSSDNDGDMLLYQWGTHDWGNGNHFEFNITRQLIEENSKYEDDDDNVWQLSLTFRSEPNDQTAELGAGNKWCHRQKDLTQFLEFILSSRAYQTVMRLQSNVELIFENTG